MLYKVMIWLLSAFIFLPLIQSERMKSTTNHMCTSLVVSFLPSHQGISKLCWTNELWKILSLFSEDVRGTLRFISVSHLLTFDNDIRLMRILTSVSCLMTVADVNSDTEASKLIDFITKIRLAQKYLTIVNPKLNEESLQNKTINFNVVMHHHGPGGIRLTCWDITLNIYVLQMENLVSHHFVPHWERLMQFPTMDSAQSN